MNPSETLAEELHKTIEGEVRFDDGSRALYATDASNYRQVPIGVVLPKTKNDILQTVALCRKFGAPILSRGGGTSLAGQCCNVAVILDLSKYYNRILDLDARAKTARVQPGVVLDTLRHTAEKQGLTFGPDPATHSRCTLGGMMGNNSCGVHALMAGKTVDNVISLEILTYDSLVLEVGVTSDADLERFIAEGGRKSAIYLKLKQIRDRYAERIRARYPRIPRRVSGYNLDELLPENQFNIARALIGSESTCVVILEATLRLVDWPAKRSLVVLGYPSIFEAGDHVPEILKSKPIGLEAIDDRLATALRARRRQLDNLAILPPGNSWLLVEFGGDSASAADAKAAALMNALQNRPGAPSMKLCAAEQEQKALWKIREGGLSATAFVPGKPDTYEGWDDSAVPPDKIGAYLRELRALYTKYGYDGILYGHFGDGCIHSRINFDLVTAEGLQKFRGFLDEAADLVIRYGGSLSGEHGDGQARAELLPKMFGPELIQAFEDFKTAWDPDWKMNPGKIVRPNRILDNLRLGADYHPAKPATRFSFQDYDSSFARAALRCVGVGECRKTESGTMCPSYMATMEEKHSTRGRARLLFEMLRGEVIKGGWKSEPVKEALDLCLACKGCKSECPVSVDMATYKAEFLSHYYEGRRRPLRAYAFGLVAWWARLASRAPRLMNFLGRNAVTGGLVRQLMGIAPQRQLPELADHTFQKWFAARPQKSNGPPVLLWPDTFSNYFYPGVAEAAVEVLEQAGFRVIVPLQAFCCGRPLYDYGMLDQAKNWLAEILKHFQAPIREGIPFVVLEPSCASVFRDELVNLFPKDSDALQLSRQTYLLSEFLMQRAPNFAPPTMNRKAVLQGHCHQKVLMTMTDEEALLKKMGMEVSAPDSGCCGMAGAFGFEADHFDVSMKVGERVLLPAARQAAEDTLLIADGFSCREQIRQGAGRKALHLAEVLRMALRPPRK